MSDWTPLRSSNLRAVRYHPTAGVLDVRFVRGGTWSYPGVDPEVHRGLLAAASAGRYFNDHVRGLPDAVRLDEELAPVPHPASSPDKGDLEHEPGRGAEATPPPAPLPPGLVASGLVRTAEDGSLFLEGRALPSLNPGLMAFVAGRAAHDPTTDRWVLP